MDDPISRINAIWGNIEVASAVGKAAKATDNLYNLTPRDWQEFMYALKEQGFTIVYDPSLNKTPPGVPLELLADRIATKIIEKFTNEELQSLFGKNTRGTTDAITRQ